jgi:hypothetical protein
MFYVLLINLLLINFCDANNPILIASPYPFNTSQTSHIECFTNDQSILLSLTITPTMLDTNNTIPSLQSTKDNIVKNGSVVLTIPPPFNYSQLYPKIECRSKYHHGVQKISQLDVLSAAEIPGKEFLSMNGKTKEMITINCLAYGTNVCMYEGNNQIIFFIHVLSVIHWDFTKDISKNIFGPLPIGIRIHRRFTLNDTLIIDHVSYSDHQGYYRCYATNKLIGITYEDKSMIHLKVTKNTIWIPIVIVCVVIGLCILLLIFCSKYCQKRRKNQLEVNKIPGEDEEMIKKIISNRESTEFSSHHNKQKSSEQIIKNVEELKLQQQQNLHTRSHSENSSKSQISLLNPVSISKTSPQFVLGNPFLDANVQPFISAKQYIDKLQ